MNIIAPHYIRDYLTEKFEENYKLSSSNDEMIVPSLFVADDYKRHMSVNLNTGLWQCFKSGNKGNFIQLYAYLEGITYNKAESAILFKELLDGKVFSSPEPQPKKKTNPDREKNLGLVPVTLESYDSENSLVQKAWTFLYERKLFNLDDDGFQPTYYVATGSRVNTLMYRNRLIIPFENNSGIFYFQARALGDEAPKYLNATGDWPKSSSVLYPFDTEEDHVVVCEGPFDAISLQLQGVNATCTLGCSISDLQVEELKSFEGKIIVGYDNDAAGRKGVNRFDYLRRLKRMADLHICHPPSEVKDWNEAHMKGMDLKRYVGLRTTKYDYDYLVDHLLTTL
jgi:5S rRNA maturation endonuclease (ribonuclease M5)